MKATLFFAGFVASGAAFITAQQPVRATGALHATIPLASGSGFLSQESILGAVSSTIDLRAATGPTPGVLSSLAMPFDVPGRAIYVGSQVALVCGKHSGSGTSHVCALAISPSAPYDIVQLSTVALPGFDAAAMVYNPAEGRIYVYDWTTKQLKTQLWTVGSPLVAFSPTLDLSGISQIPARLDVARFVGESAQGVYLRDLSSIWSAQAFTTNITKRVHVVEAGGVWTATVIAEPAGTLPNAGWTVDEPRTVSYLGPLKVAGGTGTFNLRTAAGGAVLSGFSANALAWTNLNLSTPLEPGQSYYLDGGAFVASQAVWPTYRAGTPIARSNYVFLRGSITPALMRVGELDFAVWADVAWSGTGATSNTQITSLMWAKIAEPGPESIEVLATGETIIKNPDVTFGFDPDDTPIHAGLRVSLHKRPLPIPADDGLVGTPILFQFLAVVPTGEIIGSDVFGSRILPSGATFQSASSGVSAGNPNQLEHARAWARGCSSLSHHQQRSLAKRIRDSIASGSWQ